MKVFCFANQKGGVGKTTSCVNIAASLASKAKQVLVLDLDPQGNATTGSGIDKAQLLASSNSVLLGEHDIKEATYPTPGGYDLVPANGDLTQAELELLSKSDREFQLRKALNAVTDEYDYIFIDCPPSLNMLTVNALVAAEGVIIPVQCEFYALEGLTALLNTIQHLQQTANPNLKIRGILRTMYDGRNALTNEVSNQLLSVFSSQVFETVIPRNVRLAEAPSYGLPAMLYDASATGTKAYLAVADELLS
jgi:chromosome partitioning protein